MRHDPDDATVASDLKMVADLSRLLTEMRELLTRAQSFIVTRARWGQRNQEARELAHHIEAALARVPAAEGQKQDKGQIHTCPICGPECSC